MQNPDITAEHHFWPLVLAQAQQGLSLALATILHAKGSTPRGPGTRLALTQDGTILGTVGGGGLEHAVVERAKACLSGGEASFLDFSLSNSDAAAEGMVCGGEARVLVERLDPEDAAALASLFLDSRNRGKLLVRDVRDAPAVLGSHHLADSPLQPTTATYCERIAPPRRLCVVGGGHVGASLARFADAVGFLVEVVDDRPEFTSPERLPKGATGRTAPAFTGLFDADPPGPDDLVAIMTRGHTYDLDALDQALATEAGYIGMIGSRKKRDAVFAALRDRGVAQEALDRVHCPIGLSIGAKTPDEIAVSIVAELIAFRAGMQPGPGAR